MQHAYFLKSNFAKLLYASGFLHRRIRRLPMDSFIILMYHRVLPGNRAKDLVQPGMYVLPETFERHIRFIQRYFILGRLDTIEELNEHWNQKPHCFITFDDGWLDFYEYAFPILQRYNAPATVFLPTGFIGTNAMFWTDRLAFLLNDAPTAFENRLSLSQENDFLLDRVLRLPGTKFVRIESAINLLKEQRVHDIKRVLNKLSDLTGVLEKNKQVFMSWEQIRELKASGLVSFGSHTVNHHILTSLQESGVQRELRDSMAKLIQEQAANSERLPFCYPNGNFSEKIKTMVQKTGYSLACTTQSGINAPGYDPFALKRIGVHEDMTAHNGLFGCRLLNIF